MFTLLSVLAPLGIIAGTYLLTGPEPSALAAAAILSLGAAWLPTSTRSLASELLRMVAPRPPVPRRRSAVIPAVVLRLAESPGIPGAVRSRAPSRFRVAA
ncbi:hypothetical protein [Microbacterium album]|uniref:Uncharacterized protein n=1 Tax=Microbacterium album TaxID=2053191 RepID=A0A917MK89_9MICO|nr:hypothetical protein [Microbacterium album]GGH35352.1 hypothetical protein GCM10010921_03690 [Microbacterium album]